MPGTARTGKGHIAIEQLSVFFGDFVGRVPGRGVGGGSAALRGWTCGWSGACRATSVGLGFRIFTCGMTVSVGTGTLGASVVCRGTCGVSTVSIASCSEISLKASC